MSTACVWNAAASGVGAAEILSVLDRLCRYPTPQNVRFDVEDIESTVAELRSRGVVFEEYDLPGLKTVDGIAEIEGNYASKGTGERAAWFHDSEGNLLGIGQTVP